MAVTTMEIDFKTMFDYSESGCVQSRSNGAAVMRIENQRKPINVPILAYLNNCALIIQNGQATLTSVPAVNSRVVSDTIEKLDSGEYMIDSERVAQKIFEFEEKLERTRNSTLFGKKPLQP